MRRLWLLHTLVLFKHDFWRIRDSIITRLNVHCNYFDRFRRCGFGHTIGWNILCRKMLLIASLAGCAFGLSAMSAYFYCVWLEVAMSTFWWVPITSFGTAIFMALVGIVRLSMVCLVELLPSKVRSFGLTVGTILMTIFSFVFFDLSPILTGAINVYGLMLTFAGICVFGIFFIIFFVDETKDKKLDLLDKVELETNDESV